MVGGEVAVEGEGGAGTGEDTEATKMDTFKVDLHIAVQRVMTAFESL